MKIYRMLIVLAAASLAGASEAHAALPEIMGSRLLDGILSTLIYGFIGIFMAALSFKVIDLATPGDLHKQLCDEKNVALGLVVGLLMLGLCIIIAAAVAG